MTAAGAVTPVLPAMPKGDPSLGERLIHLPKEERKQYKASDANRVARRLAKKKARNALGKQGVKPIGKERSRVRKSVADVNNKRKERVVGANKGRARSEKSLARKNLKK